jgi:uncharacterized protein (TIGR02996 family)
MLPAGHLPFLRAICDHPADDAPRLVFADWLDEHGDPDRARFIRVQVALAAARGQGEEPADLVDQDRALRRTFEIRWRCELPVLSGVIWQQFDRGFVGTADFSDGDWFVQQAGRAFAAAPLQTVRLLGLSDRYMARIADTPALGRVEGLTVADPHDVTAAGWQDFGETGHLNSLRSLHIVRTEFGSVGPYVRQPVLDLESATHLANSPALANLQVFVVRGRLARATAGVLRDRFGPRFRRESV